MKPLFVISCPIDTYSGYGSRSRDLVKSIIELNKYDVKIIPQRWGNTPWNFINDNPEWEFLNKHLWAQPQLPKQPEIWMQITIPSEFQPIGKYNIGVTAGIETTVAPGDWIEGINRMNLTLVSSEHAKKVFETSAFEEKNQQGQITRQIKLEKPVEVLFEGIKLDSFKKGYTASPVIESALKDVKEDFAFVVSKEVTALEMTETIEKSAGDLLESVRLFDVYEGSNIAEGKKSMAFSLRFRAPDRTLKSEEIVKLRGQIVSAIEKQHQGSLRA